jgi:hypothetical protein
MKLILDGATEEDVKRINSLIKRMHRVLNDFVDRRSDEIKPLYVIYALLQLLAETISAAAPEGRRELYDIVRTDGLGLIGAAAGKDEAEKVH